MKRLLLFAAVVVLVSGALVVVGVLPASTYLRQQDDVAAIDARLAAVRADNRTLRTQIRRLESDAEVVRLARQQFGMIRPGQEVYAIPGLRRGDATAGSEESATLGNEAAEVVGTPASSVPRRSVAARIWDAVTFW